MTKYNFGNREIFRIRFWNPKNFSNALYTLGEFSTVKIPLRQIIYWKYLIIPNKILWNRIHNFKKFFEHASTLGFSYFASAKFPLEKRPFFQIIFCLCGDLPNYIRFQKKILWIPYRAKFYLAKIHFFQILFCYRETKFYSAKRPFCQILFCCRMTK